MLKQEPDDVTSCFLRDTNTFASRRAARTKKPQRPRRDQRLFLGYLAKDTFDANNPHDDSVVKRVRFGLVEVLKRLGQQKDGVSGSIGPRSLLVSVWTVSLFVTTASSQHPTWRPKGHDL